MSAPHPIHRRYHAEQLVRLRRAGERRRHAGSQRRGRIDPNPHQIDAVMFALRRIPEGGCVLADEVGLGKTIEAGLVIAQLLAEGATRVLIVVPRPLLGQWQQELLDLFGIDAREAARADTTEAGVYLAGREYAGSERGGEQLGAGHPFDLCIIDEAHEVFAGIHRRFDAHGGYLDSSPHAQTAHRVRKLVGLSPVLLLTATPIQNSLAELWGLVQYVEPTGTLLGSLPTFKSLFCSGADARALVPEQSAELRRRLGAVVQRTLRRQAVEFLDRPFVGRRALLFRYTMSPEERALYDDVTRYLLEPALCAFQGRGRQLLLLGFHRRMASSLPALASSLDRVAARLRAMLRPGQAPPEVDAALLADLEEEDEPPPPLGEDAPPPPASAVQAELARVEAFAARARALPHDSKAESLLKAVAGVANRREGRRKVVVFTESLTTQAYLAALLVERGGLRPDDITLFRGDNDTPRAREALARWAADAGAGRPSRSLDVALRLALVHELEHHSTVFISTEAGAKGLNLQFCDTLINYDLPWNPQRIEQRIGRCHRYGQSRDVTVINFLAEDNAAQQLTFEILSQKLDLFGEVLDMSDTVLHTPRSDRSLELCTALGPDFEAQLRKIWDRARSIEDVEEELRRLRDTMEERRQALDRVKAETVGLIETRLDASVRQVFRQIREELPEVLAELDDDLLRVATAYLQAVGVPFQASEAEGRRTLVVPADDRLPGALAAGVIVALGQTSGPTDTEPLHTAHPLIEAAVAEARQAGAGSFTVSFHLPADAPEPLARRRGARGRLAVTRVSYRGFEREDRLLVTALFEGAELLAPAELAHELLRMPCEARAPLDPPLAVSLADLDEVVDEELFLDQSAVDSEEQARFTATLAQLDQFMEDRVLLVRRVQAEVQTRLREAEARRDAALGADPRAQADQAAARLQAEIEELDMELERLTSRDDPDYVRHREHAHRRRFEPPRSVRLFDVELVIDG